MHFRFKAIVFHSLEILPEDSRGYLQYISFYLKNKIFVFFQMSALRTTFSTMPMKNKQKSEIFKTKKFDKQECFSLL